MTTTSSSTPKRDRLKNIILGIFVVAVAAAAIFWGVHAYQGHRQAVVKKAFGQRITNAAKNNGFGSGLFKKPQATK